MIHRLTVTLAILGLVAPAEARDFTIDDALAIRDVAGAQISPDGRWIAYVETRNHLEKDRQVSQIFMVSRDGAETLKMTGDAYSASDPEWSADGNYLSFIAARDDLDEHAAAQVFTLNLKGGEAQPYTKVPQGVEDHEWSPDGKTLLLVIRDESKPAKENRERREKGEDEKEHPFVIDRRQFKEDGVGYLDRSRAHLYLVDERDGAPRQITFGDYEDGAPVFRPDGAEIAFVSNRSDEPDGNDNSDIFIVSTDAKAKKGALRKLTDNPGPDHSPAWSGDGMKIAYVASVRPELLWYATQHLAVIDAAGGAARLVTAALDRNIGAPRFAPAGKTVYATIEDDGRQKLAEIALDDGAVRPLIDGADTVFEFDVGRDGAIAAPVSRPDRPDEIHLYTNGALSRLTHVNDAALKDVRFSTPIDTRFRSADGTDIQGFVYPPARPALAKNSPRRSSPTGAASISATSWPRSTTRSPGGSPTKNVSSSAAGPMAAS